MAIQVTPAHRPPLHLTIPDLPSAEGRIERRVFLAEICDKVSDCFLRCLASPRIDPAASSRKGEADSFQIAIPSAPDLTLRNRFASPRLADFEPAATETATPSAAGVGHIVLNSPPLITPNVDSPPHISIGECSYSASCGDG